MEEEYIFKAHGAMVPTHSAIRDYRMSNLAGLYTMTIAVLSFVMPFVFYTASERSNAVLVIFDLYLYFGSFIALVYMHITINLYRSKREDKFIEQLEMRETYEVPEHSQNEIIIETCRELRKMTDKQSQYSEAEEGVHLLTRIGVLAFALAAMIMYGLRLMEFSVDDSQYLQCFGGGFIAIIISHVLFIFAVAGFLFKHHKIMMHTHIVMMKFFVGHILAAALGMWSTTVIMEALDSYAHVMHDEGHGQGGHSSSVKHQGDLSHAALTTMASLLHTKGTANPHHSRSTDKPSDSHKSQETETKSAIECLTQKSIGTDASPYLFPFIIEFALIVAASMHHIYHHIKRHEDSKSPKDKNVLVDVTQGYECHKATLGLFLGILILAVTLVFVSIHIALDTTSESNKIIVANQYFSTYIMLNLIGLLVVFICFHRMRHLGFVDHLESSLDQNLLYLSLGGCYFMIFLELVAASDVLYRDRKNSLENYFSQLHVTAYCITFVQKNVQTVFIVLALRMRSNSLIHVVRKPGRAALTFLLMINIAMWLCNTFMQRMLTESIVMRAFYGETVWVILFNIFLPLTIFYRFHSAICLTEIWIEAYKLEKEHPHPEEHEDHPEHTELVECTSVLSLNGHPRKRSQISPDYDLTSYHL